MAAKKRTYSSYQKKVIKRFYENRDAIETQRLQEIVTEIYLAGGSKKADKLWERAAEILARTPDLDPRDVAHVVENRDVEGLAKMAGARFG